MLMMSSTPPPRQPRRMLKKTRPKKGDKRRRREIMSSSSSSPFGNILPGILSNNKNLDHDDHSTSEYRPLVPSVRRVMGEDYWIDPIDLEREQQRQKEKEQQRRQRNNDNLNDNDDDNQNNPKGRRRRSKLISNEKLWTEIKAPYQQNWIGYFSVMVAILSIIITQFPELLEPAPTMQYPDL